MWNDFQIPNVTTDFVHIKEYNDGNRFTWSGFKELELYKGKSMDF